MLNVFIGKGERTSIDWNGSVVMLSVTTELLKVSSILFKILVVVMFVLHFRQKKERLPFPVSQNNHKSYFKEFAMLKKLPPHINICSQHLCREQKKGYKNDVCLKYYQNLLEWTNHYNCSSIANMSVIFAVCY